jgi:pimeloyl-ACP methyl ester carboxylesterase
MAFGLARAALTLALIAAPAAARPAQPADVGTWNVYGSTTAFTRDDQVSGHGALTVRTPAKPGAEWDAGAIMAIPDSLAHGQPFTAFFWARAARPIATNVTLQGAAAPYPIIASKAVDLTPEWREYAVTATPQQDLPAGSQQLVVRLGKASTDVTLGPVLFAPGKVDQSQVRAAFAHFQPAQTVQDVHVPSDPGVILAGRLRLPGRHARGPVPVVLLIAGSGRSGRGVFPLLEQRLLAAGIATFDYDKRGVGESTGTYEDTLEQVERDARVVVAYLRTRPELAPRRIAIVGLSQGAVVAPALAAEDRDIAAIVMMAGIAGTRQQVVFDQIAHQLAAAGIGRDASARMIATIRALLEAKDQNRPAAEVAMARQAVADAFTAAGLQPEEVKAGLANLDSPIALSGYRLDASGTLAEIRAPVLALYAEKDDLVPTATMLPFAKAALRANPEAAVSEIPNTNHGFQLPGAVQDGKQEWTGAVASAPGVADMICRWLEVRLLGRKGR